MRALLISMLLLVLCLPLASAATLQGTIYNGDLTIATDVLVSIDTEPVQRSLSRDGSYAFDVPPGEYTIKVTYLEYGVNATTEETVHVVQDGSFTFDLFLFPDLDTDEELYQDLDKEFADAPDLSANGRGTPWLIGLLILLLIVVSAAIWMRRPKKGADTQGTDLADELLHIIRREGGRMSQKELRKRVPHSEAKVSLVVAELEAKGKLEKLKKGRGNILVLK